MLQIMYMGVGGKIVSTFLRSNKKPKQFGIMKLTFHTLSILKKLVWNQILNNKIAFN